MNETTTSTEPPDILAGDGDGDGEDYTVVDVSVCDGQGTHTQSRMSMCADDDDAIADALLRAVRGVAAQRGPGLQVALAQRFGGAW